MSEMTGIDRDSDSRSRIVSDMGTNFFVEAGAGSGKTTMLVNRMAAMVESGIPIDKICAITFTKAAAGEFYDRFQRLLIERSDPGFVPANTGHAGSLPAPTDESRRRCAEALKDIDLCFMGTIDSFCGMVLSEHPSEAQIPSDASIISDTDAATFYKQMYVRISSGAYGEELARMASVFGRFYRDPEEVFVQAESVLMNNRNVHFNFPDFRNADIDNDFAQEREQIVDVLKILAEHPELISESNAPSRAAKESIGEIYATLRKKWSRVFSNVMYYLGILEGIRIMPAALQTYGVTFDGLFEQGSARDGSLDIVIGKENGFFKRLRDMQYGVTMTFLTECVPYLEQEMREKGNLTFFDCLYYLREMLRRDAEKDGKLINYIYERHSYFLIDEFQDTNPLQAEVFFYLTAEHPAAQWSSCVPRPGSLFIVGDPKQSIYRFRGADVNSFLRVRGLFEQSGGSVLTLSRNFRSTKTLCEYFNKCFTAMLPDETADQSRFEEIPLPADRPGEFTGIYKYTAYTGELERLHPYDNDPARIAEIIERLVGRDDCLVRTSEDSEPRKIRYSDIMVITYGKKRLGPIMKYLEEREIPTRVEGDVPFGENEALKEIYKIYSAVADADDRIALYGALTGKLIGLSGDDMLSFISNGGTISIKSSFDADQCTDDTAKLVASKIEELKILHIMAKRLSPAALFVNIMESYMVYETVEAENLEVVYYTLELLRSRERSGIVVSLKDGASYIAGLIAGNTDEERCLSLDTSRDAVHMANLHKVKGLEAPVIILAAATAFYNPNDKRIVHGDNGSEGYIFQLPRKDDEGNTRGSYFKTDAYADKQNEENAASLAENKRLIYVAATRARNVLIICDSIRNSFGKEKHVSAWSPVMQPDIPDLFDTLPANGAGAAVQREKADPADLYRQASKGCVLADRGAEEATYNVENPSHLHISSKVSEEVQTVIPGTVSEVHRFPALLGTMTHKLMEILVSSRGSTDAAAVVDEIIREYRTSETEPYEKELAKSLSDVAQKMRSGGYEQTNGLPQDLFSVLMGADDVMCEVPFCYREESPTGYKLWNGVMDVVYRENGKWHIVDYKTNADGSDLDSRYAGQLEAYVKAFRAVTGEEADAATYHIDI